MSTAVKRLNKQQRSSHRNVTPY